MDSEALVVTNSSPIDTVASSDETVLFAFMDMMQQYLEALSDVFPECLKVQQYKFGLNVRLLAAGSNAEEKKNVIREAIVSYHASMSPYYARCIEHDDTLLLEDIDLMRNIDMPQKWTPDLHSDTKNAMWEYITKLNEFSNIYNMYSKIPCNMLTSIENMAHSIVNRIESGNLSMSDLNMQTMSEQVMSSLNMSDLQEFASRMQSGDAANMIENMSTMYSMMGSLMKGQDM